MSNIRFKTGLILFIVLISNIVRADGWEITENGKMYKYNGEYITDHIIRDGQDLYYMNEDGIMVKNDWIEYRDNWYYANSNGLLYKSNKYIIKNKAYYFDDEGRMLTGWIDDTYYANEDGSLVTGFQDLVYPKEWNVDDEIKNNNEGWFFFGGDYKKVCSDNDFYTVRAIGNDRYCFDQNGIMRTGWRVIKETEPVMAGYMYFSELENDDFKYGTAISNSWYAIDLPDEIMAGGIIRYFYFTPTGYLKCAKPGGYIQVKINKKTYLFNEYGYAVYGIRKVDNEYYYYGNSDADCSMRTGKYTIEDSTGTRYHYYFKDNGEGFTGVYQNKLYYKGLLQVAGEYTKYEAFKVDGVVRLVNESGTVMKNKKLVKDASGTIWSTNGTGIVTYTDEGIINEPSLPLVMED